ncbi:MAG: hypothetical protein RL186_679 [Pseudomonadota bacterium]|jgi:hypothetical protein
MIQRRTLLTALSLSLLPAFMSACARAQPSPAATATGPLLTGDDAIVWLRLSGTVRQSLANAAPRKANLLRAIGGNADTKTLRVFDIWQVEGGPEIAAASPNMGPLNLTSAPNDLGSPSLWLERTFTHPALTRPLEFSRLSTTTARILILDPTQIWLLEGSTIQDPSLSPASQAAFEGWRRG